MSNTKTIVGALTKAAESGWTPSERISAIESLGNYLHDPEAVRCLAHLATSARTPNERIAATKALGNG